MARQHEADVWIVPLSPEPLEPGHPLTFREVPRALKRYFYRAGSRRKLKTEYIGFRYDGKLQALARIAAVRNIPNFDAEIPGLTVGWASLPHIALDLADISPFERTLRSGRIWNSNNIYCDMDLLMTCSTIQEAAQKTSARRNKK